MATAKNDEQLLDEQPLNQVDVQEAPSGPVTVKAVRDHYLSNPVSPQEVADHFNVSVESVLKAIDDQGGEKKLA